MKIIIFLLFSFIYTDCSDFLTATDCGAHSECEWHADEMACEDAAGGHDDHNHGDEVHCEDFLIESDCTAETACEWHMGHCEDVVSADCSDTNHYNTDGLGIEYNETEIYSQFQGFIQGSVEIDVNGTKDLSLHFLDSNGDEIAVDESTVSCYPLSFNVADPSIISVAMENHDSHDDHGEEEHCEDFLTESDCGAHSECEWHADDTACEDVVGGHDDHDHEEETHGGHLSFELSGLAVGSTTFTVSIMHNGHADYTSAPIFVTVNEEDNQVCTPGDINNDSIIDVVDIVAMVQSIISGIQPVEMCAYDLNADSVLNVVDVVAVVNIIIGNRSTSLDATSATLILADNSLNLESNGFVQGVQVTLSHDRNFSIDLVDAYISDYVTSNNMTTLVVVSDGSTSITEIATFNGDCKVEDVHVANSTGDVTVEETVELVSFNVEVAGPNPFNPSTKLNIVVPEAGYVSVKVYNVLGQEVANLVDGQMDASSAGHLVNWNAGNLASGVYIVRAATAGKVSTQKLMLLK